MKALMVVTLILSGIVWLFYATMIPSMMRTRALSDAMQLEADLKRWAVEKVWEGKLDESDVQEIFPEQYALRFGGEHPDKNFREMIEHIAQSSAPPVWPGAFMILVGIIAGIRSASGSRTQRTAADPRACDVEEFAP
jgi:hypothetical protein